MAMGRGDCAGARASGVIVFTIGTGFVVPPPISDGREGWVSGKVAPHVLQKVASSALLLPQDEHCRIVEA